MNHVYKYGGYALAAYFMFSLGASTATGYFQVPHLWQKANALEHAERTTIPRLRAEIPHGTSGKTENASTEPSCVTVHPPPE